MNLRLPLLLFAAARFSTACSTYEAPGCVTGADCTSGVCDADGTCAAATTGLTSSSSSSGGTGASGTCTPTHDGSITLDEVPLRAGLQANFRVADSVTVDTAGTMNADGSRTWDLSMTLSGDHDQAVDTLPIAGQWFAGEFPGATYTALLSYQSSTELEPDMMGAFEVKGQDLLLLGIASPTNTPLETELPNSPGATILSFPLVQGATWSSSVAVAGVFDDTFTSYTDSYASQVDAHGTLLTPYGLFPVLRVGTVLTRSALSVTLLTQRTFAFVAECFGTVATITSETNETTVEFTSASEVSRLAP